MRTEYTLLLLLGSSGLATVNCLPLHQRFEPPSSLDEALQSCEESYADKFKALEHLLVGAVNASTGIEGLATLKHTLHVACARRRLVANLSQAEVDTLMGDVQTDASWSGAADYATKILNCLVGSEESETLTLLQDDTKLPSIPAYIESVLNSVLGNIIGSIPATYYAKAQCILYASPPAPDTGSPRAAYSSWATVQQAIRFALLAYHDPPTINYLFSSCKTGEIQSPIPSKEVTTCGPSTATYSSLRYENYYSSGAKVDKCAEWWGGYSLVRFFDSADTEPGNIDKGTQGLIAKHSDGKTVWVAFRGSENPASFDLYHIQDWIKDLTFKVVPWPYKDGVGNVHKGFLEQYEQARNAKDGALTVLNKLYDDGYRNFYFTGHSLGGALAQVAALDFALARPDARTEMISVAAPEVGDKALAATHKANVKFATRVVYNTDVVTCAFGGLPSILKPLIMGVNGFTNPYVDNAIGKLLYYSVKEKKWRGTRDYECFSSDWLSSIAPFAGALDHACQGYIEKSFVAPTY